MNKADFEPSIYTEKCLQIVVDKFEMPGCCYLGLLKKKTKEVLLFGIRDFAIFAQEIWGSPPLREVELKEIELAKYRRNTSCGETECFRLLEVKLF